MNNRVFLGMFDFVGDAINDTLETILHNTIYTLCYYISKGLCFIVHILDSMFKVVAGIDKIKYLGKPNYLIDVFFGHSMIQTVYTGMAIIGMIMAFVFAIIAAIRKAADIEDMQKTTHTIIVKNLIKTIVIIAGLTFFMQVVLQFSNILMERITYIFDTATTGGKEEVITYTDEEYAAMGRVLNKIGNYSLNPSYRSRYNLDACYNDIRGDLQFLWESGKFSIYYDTDGNTWQTLVQSILNTTNPKNEIKSDVYYENISNAILNAMNIVKNDRSLKALSRYETGYKSIDNSTPLDVTIFLMGSMNAAMNSAYNVSPSVNDPLRFPYYVQKKSIYDFDQVDKDFNISISKMDYTIIWISCIVCMFNLAQLIFSCIGRMFNMMLLYIAAPPLVSTYPLDNGGKLKQWFTAFVVQCFAVFGTVIAMRLLIIFLPIIASSDLVIFPNDYANLMAKLVIIIGATMTASKANSLITGILADNAGMQAIGSAERESARGEAFVKGAGGLALGGAKLGLGLGWGATKLGAKGVWKVGKWGVNKVRNAGSDDTSSQEQENKKAGNMDSLETPKEDASFSSGSVTKPGGGGGSESNNPTQQKKNYENVRNIAGGQNKPPKTKLNEDLGRNLFGLNKEQVDNYNRTGNFKGGPEGGEGGGGQQNKPQGQPGGNPPHNGPVQGQNGQGRNNQGQHNPVNTNVNQNNQPKNNNEEINLLKNEKKKELEDDDNDEEDDDD